MANAQLDAVRAALADNQTALDATKSQVDVLVNLTNTIFAQLQGLLNNQTGSIDPAEIQGLLDTITAQKAEAAAIGAEAAQATAADTAAAAQP